MRELMLACVLEALVSPSSAECAALPRVRAISSAILEATEKYPTVPAEIVAAVIRSESSFDPRAIGDGGQSVGLMQTKRGGALTAREGRWSDRRLMDVQTNVRLGVRYLALMQKRCRSTDPRVYLSRYNGRPCKKTSYSKKVLGRLQIAKRVSVMVTAMNDGNRL